jgi:hypothetical protein
MVIDKATIKIIGMSLIVIWEKPLPTIITGITNH